LASAVRATSRSDLRLSDACAGKPFVRAVRVSLFCVGASLLCVGASRGEPSCCGSSAVSTCSSSSSSAASCRCCCHTCSWWRACVRIRCASRSARRISRTLSNTSITDVLHWAAGIVRIHQDHRLNMSSALAWTNTRAGIITRIQNFHPRHGSSHVTTTLPARDSQPYSSQ
jgi:hypothetical protein